MEDSTVVQPMFAVMLLLGCEGRGGLRGKCLTFNARGDTESRGGSRLGFIHPDWWLPERER